MTTVGEVERGRREMEFGVLGPLRVHDGSRELLVPAAKQRVLLAALVLRPGQAVTVEDLVDYVWAGDPRGGSTASLRTHMTRLRQVVGSAGELIRTVPNGYVLDASPDDVDAARFVGAHRDGLAAAESGRWTQASDVLTEALALWRGDALADVPSETLRQREADRLNESRWSAVQWRVEADLHLGRHHLLVGELEALTAAHPLRERFCYQLMLALYRCSRQADALAAYRRSRDVLVAELGVEPGTDLTELHRRILAADPALRWDGATVTSSPASASASGPASATAAATGASAAAPASAAAAPAKPPAPAQLPAAIADFTGREADVELLAKLLSVEPGAAAAAVPVVTGVGGIGKTSLAVHAAHLVRDRFPDGQLYANLRGAGGAPRDPADVLDRFLRVLGADAPAPGDDLEDRAAAFRTVLSERRVLILLDDARDAAQVRPLLTGTPTSRVVVTSRNRLAGLDGCARIELRSLDDGDANRLFNRIAGPGPARIEPDAVGDVLRTCAGHPLAIRIAASRLVAQPGWSAQTLARRLADQGGLLDELQVDDRAVRSSFALSYTCLDSAVARGFRLLACWPGPSVGVPSAAALLDRSRSEADRVINALMDLHLLESPVPGRYRFHDLLRTYALERCAAEESGADRDAATRRIVGWYLQATAAASEQLTPNNHRPTYGLDDPVGEPTVFADNAAALDWCERERHNAVAAVRCAAAAGLHDDAWKLPVNLATFFGIRGYYADWTQTLEIARASAAQLADEGPTAAVLVGLAAVTTRLGRPAEAVGYAERAAAIHRALGDHRGEGTALNNLAIAISRTGDHGRAIEVFHRAADAFAAAGLRRAQAMILSNIGATERWRENYQKAHDCFREALEISREVGDDYTAGKIVGNLAEACHMLDRLDEGEAFAHQALAATRATGNRAEEGAALELIGLIVDAQGRRAEAVELWRESLAIFVDIDDEDIGRLEERLRDAGALDTEARRSPS